MQIRYRRLVALLFTGALLLSLPSCGRPMAQAADDVSTQRVVQDRSVYGSAAQYVGSYDTPKEEPKKEEPGDGFHFPDDKGGQILAKVLPPADRLPPADPGMTSAPKR